MEWKYKTIEREGFSFLIAENDSDGPHLFWLGSALYYPRVIPETLAKEFKMTIVDHRGFAKRNLSTPESESTYDLETVLNDFHFFQNLLEIPPCLVLGHSGHGYMALAYAKKYPDLVTKLLLVATGPSHGAPLQERESYFEALASVERKEKHRLLQSKFQTQIQSNPEGLVDFFNLYCVSQDALGFYDLSIDSTTLWEGVKTNKLAFDFLFGKVFVDIKVDDYLSEIKCPITLVLGRYDFQVAPHYTWDPILQRFPGVKKRVMDHCGHLPFYERPEEFVSAIP
ncbi:alpha/beta hydrolase family protein [Leptospira yanagawae serovar Saopaulo str. Sao Paulo = ATCC 700523]|uniref:Alpha/beta hydrolase family protein n=2 Tax=Leptospira yanagawae TaxID=293069 RepID=A0A5E8HB90_9LEPT|nr:alpha/beta hydrolase family protein [Leptospira yanagawae serovar Saopaulo str. Sao Paulo = ATCC 700523]